MVLFVPTGWSCKADKVNGENGVAIWNPDQGVPCGIWISDWQVLGAKRGSRKELVSRLVLTRKNHPGLAHAVGPLTSEKNGLWQCYIQDAAKHTHEISAFRRNGYFISHGLYARYLEYNPHGGPGAKKLSSQLDRCINTISTKR